MIKFIEKKIGIYPNLLKDKKILEIGCEVSWFDFHFILQSGIGRLSCALMGQPKKVYLNDTEEVIKKITHSNLDLNPELKNVVTAFPFDWNIYTLSNSQDLFSQTLK